MLARYLNALSKSLLVAECTWQAQAAGQPGQREHGRDDQIWRAQEMGRALWIRSGAFRALQVWDREEQRNGAPVPSHLGFLGHPCSCQVWGMLPASPWSIPAAGPSVKPCEELAFCGALLPSSLQMQPETVENPGEWCRCITKWDYCRLVLCPEALLWTEPTSAKGTAARRSARKMGIIQSCNWRVRWKLSLLPS